MAHRGPVTIVGAGISGLTLARCLLHRGIPAIVYERVALRPTHHSYGITLKASAYRPLLESLRLDEETFRRKLAVDAGVGGDGYVGRDRDPDLLRANRRLLEALLREGLDIRWKHDVSDVLVPKNVSDKTTLVFRGGLHLHSSIVVAANGAPSLFRKKVSPSSAVEVLPYVVIAGKRNLPRAAFDSYFAPHLVEVGANVIEHRSANGTLLQISLHDIDTEKAYLGYTFSRPAATHGGDALFTPHRSNYRAKNVPDVLFDEVSRLTDIPAPFAAVFTADAMRKDPLLSWLMRSARVPQTDLEAAAAKGVVLIADAAHPAPILASWGACEGILDAVELARYIGEGDGQDLRGFVERQGRRWEGYRKAGDVNLGEMHEAQSTSSRL
ncbi:hypothetical protein LTR08_001332 [Meristemomyces frigidus]|nr:hypothetical protein LTR08_001332 [Meristemomyces frigidus]